MIWRRLTFAVMAVLVSISWYMFNPQLAHAAILAPICTPNYEQIDGRCMNEFYFSGNAWEGSTGAGGVWQVTTGTQMFNYVDSLGTFMDDTYSFPQNTDANDPNAAINFVNFVGSRLNPPNPGCGFPQPSLAYSGFDGCALYRSYVLGASFIILTMLGGKYDTYDVGAVFGNNVQTGVNDARAEFSKWKAAVLAADAAGRVDWNASVSFPDNHPNSGSRNWAHDVGMFLQGAEPDHHSIVFHNPGGDYIINRRCANSVGPWGTLPTTVDYHDTVQPIDGKSNGQTLDFSKPADLHVAFRIDAVNNISEGLPLPTAHTTDFDSPAWGSSDTSATACAGAPCKRDINMPLPGPTPFIGAGSFAYSLDPLTPNGTIICFKDHITPHAVAGDAGIDSDNQICYKVRNERRFPSLIGLNSDVHAGGGLCPTDKNPGNVQGNSSTGGASYGQYVVSAAPVGGAGGMINGFGSNNSPTSNKLQIGLGGNYQQICQKDLYSYAESNKNLADPIQHQLGAGTYNIDGSWAGIYYANGPVSISGTIVHKMTIVMESGDLSITGNLNIVAAGTGPRDVPSLGIITNGPAQSVFINPAATTVDAYIFSDGAIDTCGTVTVYAPPGCGNKLVVNGFLMARSMNFKRLAQNGLIGAQTGEQIELTPQVYLNPPYYFDAGVDLNQLQGLGEKQPLF